MTVDKSHSIGIWSGIISGLTYGIYTTLVMVAGYYEPLVTAAGLLAAPYVCSGLNDLFAGILLSIYNIIRYNITRPQNAERRFGNRNGC